MTYDRLSPVEGGFATLQQHTSDAKWATLMPRLEILAQETAILNTSDDEREATIAGAALMHMMGLVVAYFDDGIPEIVHQMVLARAAQIVAEKNAADTR